MSWEPSPGNADIILMIFSSVVAVIGYIEFTYLLLVESLQLNVVEWHVVIRGLGDELPGISIPEEY